MKKIKYENPEIEILEIDVYSSVVTWSVDPDGEEDDDYGAIPSGVPKI